VTLWLTSKLSLVALPCHILLQVASLSVPCNPPTTAGAVDPKHGKHCNTDVIAQWRRFYTIKCLSAAVLLMCSPKYGIKGRNPLGELVGN